MMIHRRKFLKSWVKPRSGAPSTSKFPFRDEFVEQSGHCMLVGLEALVYRRGAAISGRCTAHCVALWPTSSLG